MSNPLLDAICIDTLPPSEEYLREKLGELYESPRSWQNDFRTNGTWIDECPLCKQMYAGDVFRNKCRECAEQEEQKRKRKEQP